MASINMSSIMNKVNAYSRSVNGKLRMKECIQKYSDDGKAKTEAGDKIITEKEMYEAASKMIQVLRSTAQSPAHCLLKITHIEAAGSVEI